MLVNFCYFKEVCGFLSNCYIILIFLIWKKKYKEKKIIFEDLFEKYLSFKFF